MPTTATIPAAVLPTTPLADRPLRVYVAAPRGEAHVAALLGAMLEREGYEVVSRWTDRLREQEGVCANERDHDDLIAAIHRENQAELERADALIAWTAAGQPRATYGEIAWALCRGKPVLWLQGERGEGGSSYDTDPGVTVLRLSARDYAAHDAAGVLTEVRRMEGRLRDAPARPPVEVAPSPVLLVTLGAVVMPGDPPWSFESLCGIGRVADPTATDAHVYAALCLLVALDVLEPADPGAGGEARWRRRADLVSDLQRVVAGLREECAALRVLNETPCEKRADETMADAAKRWAPGEIAALRTSAAPIVEVTPTPTLYLTADEATALLSAPGTVYRPIADVPAGGHMQPLRNGSWEWSPDGGFGVGVVAVPCPWGESGSRVMLTEPWCSWEEHCSDEQCGDDHICSAHCHQVYVAYKATPRVGHRTVPDKARITYLHESSPLERNRHLLGPWQPAETMRAEDMREPAGRTIASMGVRRVDDGWQWVIAVGGPSKEAK